MRKAALLLALLLSLGTQRASAAVQPPQGAPVWCGTIPVMDSVALSVHAPHRALYRAARDQALAMWAASGVLAFQVTEVPPAAYTPQAMIPDTIHIGRDVIPDMNIGTFPVQAPPNPGALVGLSPRESWWGQAFGDQIAPLIAQEVGHTLGFDHGGAGVMGTGMRVSARELQALNDFYGGCT